MAKERPSRTDDGILSRYTEPAPRPVRRRVGLAVVLLVAALTGWAVTKHVTTGGLSDAKVEQGIGEMRRGVDGDESGYQQAQEAFVDAASVSVVDAYPGFLIRANQRVRDGGGDGNVHDRVAAAVAEGDFALARERSADFGENERAQEYWLRLIDALEAQPAASGKTAGGT